MVGIANIKMASFVAKNNFTITRVRAWIINYREPITDYYKIIIITIAIAIMQKIRVALAIIIIKPERVYWNLIKIKFSFINFAIITLDVITIMFLEAIF